jgi:heme-degrading monooxygenase HmoA
MYAIFFKWRLRAGMEAQFVRAWSELTELIRAESGGLGSRLHKADDDTVFAYAQWPSEEDYRRERPSSARMVELRAQMKAAAELIDGPLGGVVLQDYLVASTAAASTAASTASPI